MTQKIIINDQTWEVVEARSQKEAIDAINHARVRGTIEMRYIESNGTHEKTVAHVRRVQA